MLTFCYQNSQSTIDFWGLFLQVPSVWRPVSAWGRSGIKQKGRADVGGSSGLVEELLTHTHCSLSAFGGAPKGWENYLPKSPWGLKTHQQSVLQESRGALGDLGELNTDLTSFSFHQGLLLLGQLLFWFFFHKENAHWSVSNSSSAALLLCSFMFVNIYTLFI